MSATENMKFLVATLIRNDYRAAEIHRLVVHAWGDNYVSMRRIQQIAKEYNGKTEENINDISFERHSGSGRPRSSRTDENADKVSALIHEDKTLSCSLIAAELDIPRQSVHRIITEDLHLKSVSAKWVPYALTPPQKWSRMHDCKELVRVFRTNNITKRLFVTDEKWIYSRSLPPAHLNKVWVGPDGDGMVIAKRRICDKKFLWVHMSNFEGNSYWELLESGSTMNSARYIEFLDHAFNRLGTNVRDRLLMHDNARPHIATSVSEWLDEKGIIKVRQPPYSPDVNLMDRFIFRNFEMFRRNIVLEDERSVKDMIERFMASLTTEALKSEFRKLKNDVEAIIEKQGDYL